MFYSTINAALVAIELYFKSLTSESVHVPANNDNSAARVYAKPEVASHQLQKIYDAIKTDFKSEHRSRPVW